MDLVPPRQREDVQENEENDNGPAAAAASSSRPAEDTRGEDGLPWTVENPSLDLDAYAAGYTGHARSSRLSFVATHCPQLRVEALRLALQQVGQTHNTQLYIALHKKLAEALNEEVAQGGAGASSNNLPAYDPGWVEQKMKKAALKLEKLDTDLKNYKSNSIKVSCQSCCFYPFENVCIFHACYRCTLIIP